MDGDGFVVESSAIVVSRLLDAMVDGEWTGAGIMEQTVQRTRFAAQSRSSYTAPSAPLCRTAATAQQ